MTFVGTVFKASSLVIVVLLSSSQISVGLHPAAKKKEQVQTEKSCAIDSLHNKFVTLHLAPLCLSAHLGSSQKTRTAHSI